VDDHLRAELLAGGRLARTTDEPQHALVRSLFERWSDRGNAMLYTDMNLNLVDHVLAKVDLMSMRHGLEVRSPFLDYRVAELAFRIRSKDKVNAFGGKRILRRAFADLLPKDAVTPRKQGFELPIASWLRKELRPLFEDTVRPDILGGMELLDPAVVDRLRREHMSGWRNHHLILWTIFTLCWWWERHYPVRG